MLLVTLGAFPMPLLPMFLRLGGPRWGPGAGSSARRIVIGKKDRHGPVTTTGISDDPRGRRALKLMVGGEYSHRLRGFALGRHDDRRCNGPMRKVKTKDR